MNISTMLKFSSFVSKPLGFRFASLVLANVSQSLGTAFFLLALALSQANAQEKISIEKGSKKPLSVLLVTGGCCHDYDFQSKSLQLAAKERGVVVEWTIVNQGGKGTKAMIDLYKKANWQEGFDVVIHNECFADTDDPEYIRSITKPHYEGTNAVVIHCAMHTYRSAPIDDWREFLGVTSRHHEHQSRYPVTVVQKDHPIMKDFPADSKSAMDELYIIEKVWPSTTVLATSKSEKTGEEQPVYWTNQYGKGRVFGTTYGHSNETFSDKAFLNAVVNGIVWAAGR
jgi:type 1 glutamine amidotransferase